MDTLLIVLFVLVIFAIFVCLENSGYLEKKNNPQLIEGVNNMDEYLQEARILSSQGVCKDSNGNYIWPRDEETCTGYTAFNLDFSTTDEKRAVLESFNTPETTIEREVSLEYGDIVQVDGQEEGLFIYRGIDPINLETHEGQIALFPYSNLIGEGESEEEKLEYCYDENGLVNGVTTKDSCQNDQHNGTFFRPVLESDLDLTVVSDDFKSINCREGEDGTFSTPGGIQCFSKEQIKISHCILPDPNQEGRIYQIKPVSFWKTLYELGSNQRIEQLCEGVSTGNQWIYNSSLNTMMDSQQFAEIQSQVESSVNAGFNQEALASFESTQNLLRILPESIQELQSQQEELRRQQLNQDCSFENEDNNYHGNFLENNPNLSTANLYICSNSDAINATNVSNNCSSEQLSCDPNFAKNHPDILIKHITCNGGTFNYRGCIPDTCNLPDDFHDKYEITQPSGVIEDTVTINHLKNMVDDTLNVRCKNGYTGEPVITSCSTSINNGVLSISGCEENTCNFPSDTTGYHIEIQTEPVSLSSFYVNNTMDQSYPIDGGRSLSFKCESPNNFHVRTEEEFNTFMENISDPDKQLKDYTNYPNLVCNTGGEDSSPPYTFELSGCYENKCLNPNQNDVEVYETSVKPGHLSDTKKIVNSPNNQYEQFVFDDISSNDSSISRSDVLDKLKCGKNYTKQGEPSSGDTADKTIHPDNIQCYNFFDYYNLSDPNNTQTPNYLKNTPTSVPPTDLTDFHTTWLGNNSDVSKILPFSVTGCLENYCKWPTEDTGYYDKPQVRSSDIENLELYQINNQRYKLGYKYSTDDPGTSSIDQTTGNTAKQFVGYNETDGSITLKCTGEEEGDICENEPKYTDSEIDTMVNSADEELKKRGQPGFLTSGELKSVGRGGGFTISRCWHSDISGQDPIVSCNGDNCAREDSDCEAEVSGCSQNKCTLDRSDASNGTRILIQTSDGYKTIGGITEENMDEVFNVDQIRNITCDENYSKPSNNPTDSNKPYGGGNDIKDITISCSENGGTFTIENKCGLTQCPQEINSINGLIHLTNHNSDQNSVCPTLSLIDSHKQYYDAEEPTRVNLAINQINHLTNTEHCGNETVNEELFNYNTARYQSNGGSENNYECGVPNSLADNQSGLTSVGSVIEKCNYSPDTFDLPKRTLAGCQPKLCTLPQLPEGYTYKQDSYPTLTVGDKYSTDSILNRNYYQTSIGSENVNYLDQESYDLITRDGYIPIECSPGYTGTVSLQCNQNETEYNEGIYHPFEISGCEVNTCQIPEGLSGINFGSIDEGRGDGPRISVEELRAQITCEGNHSENSEAVIECNDNGGLFSGLETFCSENICTIPNNIEVDVESNPVYGIRDNLGNGVLPETVSETLSEELRNYLSSVGQNSDQSLCYDNLPDQNTEHQLSDLSNITCKDNCHGNVILECEEGQRPLTISGCHEKYCRLPNLLDTNNILYNFSGVRDKLQLLEEIQGIGITKNQIDATFNGNESQLSCSSFSNPGDTISFDCAENGQEFTLSGCEPLQQQRERTYTNGTTIYSYYPVGCNLSQENAFIYISGTDIFGTGEDDSGISMTHEIDRENVTPKEEVYYYRKQGDNDPEYSPAVPDNWETDGTDGWYEIPFYLHYNPLHESQRNSRIERFMNTSKDMCDKVNTCKGFNVTSFNALTSEIDAIDKSGARDEITGSVNEVRLREWIQNPNHNFLELGTFKSEQKGEDCSSNLDLTVVGFHHEWGETTRAEGQGGNSYVYNNYNGNDVLNHRVVTGVNHPIYFKQIIRSSRDASGDGSTGYTNIDEPEPVDIIDEPEPVDAR